MRQMLKYHWNKKKLYKKIKYEKNLEFNLKFYYFSLYSNSEFFKSRTKNNFFFSIYFWNLHTLHLCLDLKLLILHFSGTKAENKMYYLQINIRYLLRPWLLLVTVKHPYHELNCQHIFFLDIFGVARYFQLHINQA